MRWSIPRQSTGSSDLGLSTLREGCKVGSFPFLFAPTAAKSQNEIRTMLWLSMVTSASGLGSGFLWCFICILWPEPEPTETGKKDYCWLNSPDIPDLRAFLMSTGRSEEGPPHGRV